jgi:hypothetical protein
MSGPDDTLTDDFKLPLFDAGLTLSPKYRLRLHWDTPRLEWSPLLATHPSPDKPEFLRLDDPFAAVLAAERYILSGSMLFDMRRLNFDMIDKAFLEAPIAPPNLLPSFADMKAWEDDAFYRRLGRAPPLFGAPAPAPLLTPPIAGPAPPSPFYKLPSPLAFTVDPATPKAGQVGDVFKALMGLPFIQQNMNKLGDEALSQVRLIKNDWANAPWRDRVTAIVIAAPIAASVVGTVLGVDEARHFAFARAKGVDIPAPWVPGVSLHVDDFGKADPYLLGKPTDPHQPQSLQFGLKFDVLKAFPAIRKVF